MKTCDIAGYAYNAALHCVACTEKAFPQIATLVNSLDAEGNPVSPVFVGDEPGDCGDYCDDCQGPLGNMPDDWDAQCLDSFLRENAQGMFETLGRIVADLKATMASDPAEYTEHGCDAPSIDIRLCIDIHHCRDGGTWVFRTGSVDFDQRHSEYCAALGVGLDTNTAGLLADLIDQIKE